ncbi:Antifreeze protein, type I [Paracoccaceae bacterium]
MRIPGMQDMFLPAMEAGLMLAEAQVVIALRMAGLAGLWPMAEDEGMMMLAEKVEAGQAAAAAALRAGMGGATGGEVALAATAPQRDRTRANARRLMGA